MLELLDRGSEPAGDRETTRVQADEHDALRAVVALHDLVGDAGVRPTEVGGVEHPGPLDHYGFHGQPHAQALWGL